VSLHLRASETNLGNFFADAIRADANADIAITNAGSIRGDRMFPAGLLTRRTLVEIHSFGNVVAFTACPAAWCCRRSSTACRRSPSATDAFRKCPA
jgi:2',3'-cyclic-nucleotide 2'-phosphodiesterase (5'-nucleotidase family)